MDIDSALDELLLTRPVAENDIVQAHRRMAMRFHPDKTTDPDEKRWAQQKFVRIQQAYELLKALPLEAINGAPERKVSQESREGPEQQPEVTKRCPFCGQLIQREAIKCRFCGWSLDPPRTEETPKENGGYSCSDTNTTRWGLDVSRDPARTEETPKWYSTTATIVVATLLFGPLALPLVWCNRRYKKTTKLVITILVVVLTIGYLCLNTSSRVPGSQMRHSSLHSPRQLSGSQVSTMSAPALTTSPAVPTTQRRPAAETNVTATNPKVESAIRGAIGQVRQQQVVPHESESASILNCEQQKDTELWKTGKKELQQTFGRLVRIERGPTHLTMGLVAHFDKSSQPVRDGQVIHGFRVYVDTNEVTFVKGELGWTCKLPEQERSIRPR